MRKRGKEDAPPTAFSSHSCSSISCESSHAAESPATIAVTSVLWMCLASFKSVSDLRQQQGEMPHGMRGEFSNGIDSEK